ncbi:hypothetical protein HPB49_020019 [Dermacentor silvarum]|uniref:Uncharacterized protein n=1 Tax=Dermacentor silvarum TaxID=543639 RepID=A0ACB8E2S6_DERSI|nr:hypothetical protein HPB49_020019 [Dermacentor silvarum]
MDVQSQVEDLDPTTFRASEWTTILRAYKGGKPSPEMLVVPPHGAPVRTKSPASAVGTAADATPATFKPRYRAQQQQLRVTHAVALGSTQLASFPPDTIRVVFRPRGGLALNGAMTEPLMQALQVTAADRNLGEFHLRIHPTNNTFTVATSHESTALHLVQLKEVVLQETSYPVAAYIAPPPAAARGVISRGYWAETPEQMLRDLQTRNPEADIIAARRMSRTLSILITFAHGPPPQKTKCPIKKDFPPLSTTLPSTSTWASKAAKTNITTSQDPEVKALREKVNQLSVALSTSTPALPPTPPPPPSSSTPSDQPPPKKRRPDESPAQPIDLEAKFQDLALNLEAKFTERITAQVTAQCQTMIEATITLIMDRIISSIMTKVEERLAHLIPGLSAASPPAVPPSTPLLRPATLQHGSSEGP